MTELKFWGSWMQKTEILRVLYMGKLISTRHWDLTLTPNPWQHYTLVVCKIPDSQWGQRCVCPDGLRVLEEEHHLSFTVERWDRTVLNINLTAGNIGDQCRSILPIHALLSSWERKGICSQGHDSSSWWPVSHSWRGWSYWFRYYRGSKKFLPGSLEAKRAGISEHCKIWDQSNTEKPTSTEDTAFHRVHGQCAHLEVLL